MKDVTVTLEDRPGTLADLGEALGKAGINIEGLTAVSSEGRAIVHVLVEDAAAARTALEGARINVESAAPPPLPPPRPRPGLARRSGAPASRARAGRSR